MTTQWWQAPEYRELSNAEISDALDAMGLPGSAHGLAGVTGAQRIFGPAYTVRFAPVDILKPGTVGDFIDEVAPGHVIVLDNGGRTDCTVWGGILSRIARARGVAGTVINGVCRDSAEAVECDYAIYSRGVFMRTGKDRVQVEAIGAGVSLGDVRVNPGDFVSGDRDGIVVIPAARAREVLDRAVAIREAENAIVALTQSGKTLAQARQELGYHALQRKQ
jgi:4-hydroxy-4-methyl-2-oxoglutarate aldolase